MVFVYTDFLKSSLPFQEVFCYRYILQIRTRIDVESSMLLEEILRYGSDTATNVILRVSKRISEGKHSILLIKKCVLFIGLHDPQFSIINFLINELKKQFKW